MRLLITIALSLFMSCLSFGQSLFIPKETKKGERIDHKYYSIKYSKKHHQSFWVAYKLVHNKDGKHVKRKDQFKADPLIKGTSAQPSDYARSGYDRGHLAPAADMNFNSVAMAESFYMSNMSPQAPTFNRGIWKKLEEQVRDWSEGLGTIYIVTGPILPDTLSKKIGAHKVSVPWQYYKTILYKSPKKTSIISLILPNKGSKRPLQDYVVTTDYLEQLTGIDFFSELSDPVERKLEKTTNVEDWFGSSSMSNKSSVYYTTSTVKAKKESGDSKFNINTASHKQLTSIDGIGTATANKIISKRPFRSINDLLKVKGIGPATLSKIKRKAFVK
ncbi:MAG: DNA/RNA non-specific endonuclease [Hyphomicrobiales bacterium]